MQFLYILLAIVAVCSVECAIRTPRIVNGVVTSIEEVPYIVQVDWSGDQICSGVILSEEFVLTAAQCMSSDNNNEMRIRAGSDIRNEGGSLHHIVWSYHHPDYDIYYWEYDVAILKVDPPLVLDSTRQPITIGDANPDIGSSGFIAGWGHTKSGGQSSPVLLSANISIIENDQCFDIKDDLQFCGDSSVSAPCSGDWGGPFVQDGYLLGLGSLFEYCRTYGSYVSVIAETNRDFIRETSGL